MHDWRDRADMTQAQMNQVESGAKPTRPESNWLVAKTNDIEYLSMF